MKKALTLGYDAVGDILCIDTRPPSAESESQGLDKKIIARLNPDSGIIETHIPPSSSETILVLS